MTKIFIDESGDLGFSAFSSEYFLVVAVRVHDEKTSLAYCRIMKKIRVKLLKKKLKETPELKFSNSSDLVRKAVLLKVAELDVSIYALIIKKEYTKKDLKENIRILYNYLIKILLESVIKEVNQKEELFIFLDKCMPYSKIENFGDYIKTEFYSLYSSLPKLEINHDNSLQNGGLQVTDFICGAFGYKYNKKKLSDGCDEYTRIIQKRIVSERSDFFKKN